LSFFADKVSGDHRVSGVWFKLHSV